MALSAFFWFSLDVETSAFIPHFGPVYVFGADVALQWVVYSWVLLFYAYSHFMPLVSSIYLRLWGY